MKCCGGLKSFLLRNTGAVYFLSRNKEAVVFFIKEKRTLDATFSAFFNFEKPEKVIPPHAGEGYGRSYSNTSY